MTGVPADAPLPALPFIKYGDDGKPFIQARRCSNCQAVVTSTPFACPSCGKRNTLTPFRAGSKGVLHTFSVVYRSFPGVETPFVSAIVDVEGGVTLKGVLRGVDPKPEAVDFGMPVKVVFDDALGRKDAEGRSYISYFFEPA